MTSLIFIHEDGKKLGVSFKSNFIFLDAFLYFLILVYLFHFFPSISHTLYAPSYLRSHSICFVTLLKFVNYKHPLLICGLFVCKFAIMWLKLALFLNIIPILIFWLGTYLSITYNEKKKHVPSYQLFFFYEHSTLCPICKKFLLTLPIKAMRLAEIFNFR